MAFYATIEDIQTHGFQIADRDTARLEQLCEMFSALFDSAVGCSPGYFAKYTEGAAAAARVFWGDGTDTLKLWPYKTGSITTVAMPTGYTVPTYVETLAQPDRFNGFDFNLIRTYGDDGGRLSFVGIGNNDGAAFALDLQGDIRVGWTDGLKVTVTAIWGYDAVPMDVKLAVVESAIAGLRGIDQAYARVTNLETNTVTNATALTPRAQMIADRYRNLRFAYA